MNDYINNYFKFQINLVMFYLIDEQVDQSYKIGWITGFTWQKKQIFSYSEYSACNYGISNAIIADILA
jgi:hypothetical protein